MIFEDDNAVAEDVQRAITDLATGTNALVVKPDKTGLEKLLSKAKNLDKNKYTTVSVGQLETAITSTSTTMNNENATSSDVDAALKSLQTSLDNTRNCTLPIRLLDSHPCTVLPIDRLFFCVYYHHVLPCVNTPFSM